MKYVSISNGLACNELPFLVVCWSEVLLYMLFIFVTWGSHSVVPLPLVFNTS